MMRGLDGFGVLKAMGEVPATSGTPVVFIERARGAQADRAVREAGDAWA